MCYFCFGKVPQPPFFNMWLLKRFNTTANQMGLYFLFKKSIFIITKKLLFIDSVLKKLNFIFLMIDVSTF